MILQVVIFLSSALAMWLLASPVAHHRRIGGLVGIAAQPFWMIATAREGQWGMFALAFLYLAAYARVAGFLSDPDEPCAPDRDPD
jgi:hypothetical protein